MTTHEFDIIDRYFKRLQVESSAVVLGSGDDCAVLAVPAGEELCVSTDTLIEGVHFPENAAPGLVISRTMAANLSDLAAMGARPLSFVLAMTLPDADDDWLEACSTALANEMARYDIPLVGGNLARGSLSLTATVLGTVPEGTAITRLGATPGDEIHVTGSLGDAARGLELLRAGEKSDNYLVARYCAPTPRLEAGMALRGIATAMIDVSDGLMSEVGHLCQARGLGAEIMSDALPISGELMAAADEENATRLALFSGDDYELCFTAPAESSGEIAALAESLKLPISRVGIIVDEPGITVRRPDGTSLPYGDMGYRHF